MTLASTTDGSASRVSLRPGPFALTLPALLLLTLLFLLPLIRLPSGPSHRRYRAGEPIAAAFHAADARLIAVQ